MAEIIGIQSQRCDQDHFRYDFGIVFRKDLRVDSAVAASDQDHLSDRKRF